MPLMLQIWVVIVTLGLLGIALMALRTVTRTFDKVAQVAEDISLISLSIRESAARVDLLTNEAREIVNPVRGYVPPFLRVVERFQAIGQRTADLSSTILHEVEVPVYTAAAVARGVRTGATHLVRSLVHRFTPSRSSMNGDPDHE